MRKVVVGTFVTLDGVMQAPGGPNEDRDGGFLHGGWLVTYFDEKIGEIMVHGSGGQPRNPRFIASVYLCPSGVKAHR